MPSHSPATLPAGPRRCWTTRTSTNPPRVVAWWIDLDTGTTRPPSADDTFWCDHEGTFNGAEPRYDSSTPITSRMHQRPGAGVSVHRGDAPIPTSTIPEAVSASFPGDLRVAGHARQGRWFLARRAPFR